MPDVVGLTLEGTVPQANLQAFLDAVYTAGAAAGFVGTADVKITFPEPGTASVTTPVVT